MDWKKFFHLEIFRESASGRRPYFQAELSVPTDFELDELLLHTFDHLGLTPEEKKHMTIGHRKILLRHHYFNSKEFERIGHNFLDRLRREKENLLEFSTRGGGVYLFLALLKEHENYRNKRIVCRTSEIPLAGMGLPKVENPSLQLIYRPEISSTFDKLPTLWSKSPYLFLFEVDESEQPAA